MCNRFFWIAFGKLGYMEEDVVLACEIKRWKINNNMIKWHEFKKSVQGSINVERRGIGNENVLKQRKIWRHEEIIKLIKLKISWHIRSKAILKAYSMGSKGEWRLLRIANKNQSHRMNFI